MAWLEFKGGGYRIGFRFAGRKHHYQLKTADEKEAVASLGRFESNFRLVEQGVIDSPPEGADLGAYLISGGRNGLRPSQTERVELKTLGELLDSYLAHYPKGAKESTTVKTELIHVGHFRKHLDTKLPLADFTTRTMQAYVEARSATVGTETIKKEVGTFASVWNKWGVPQGMVVTPAPAAGLVYPKTTAKQPFQTREQIERLIASRELTDAQQAELWDCLFLTLPEVDEVLEQVRNRDRIPQAYPMFVFAAHTGARRSEIRRSLVSDFDFGSRTVQIREKKRERDKHETYRTVPLSPLLERVMKAWFAELPGGHHAVCTSAGNPITEHYATKLIVNVLKKSRWTVIPGWHCFRHSFISNCAARGVDQRLIDQWVGHTTETMRRRYRHLIPAVSQAALASVFG